MNNPAENCGTCRHSKLVLKKVEGDVATPALCWNKDSEHIGETNTWEFSCEEWEPHYSMQD